MLEASNMQRLSCSFTMWLVSFCRLSFANHIASSSTYSLNLQTWSCVPNTSNIPLLAPAYNENVCPHWAERWELRTRPLGCQVSSITSLTAIVTIISTLVFVSLMVGLVRASRWFWQYHKKHPGWWRLRNQRWARTWFRAGELEPLLPGSWPDNGGP